MLLTSSRISHRIPFTYLRSTHQTGSQWFRTRSFCPSRHKLGKPGRDLQNRAIVCLQQRRSPCPTFGTIRQILEQKTQANQHSTRRYGKFRLVFVVHSLLDEGCESSCRPKSADHAERKQVYPRLSCRLFKGNYNF